MINSELVIKYIKLASSPWGPVTANGVDLLTEIYIIYMETHTSHPLTAAGERVTYGRKEGRKEGRKARKYIMR